MKKYNKNLSFDERVLADKVADEILFVTNDKEERRYFLLVVLLLIGLVFLVSSLSFAIFDTYYNGSDNNVVDVKVDVEEKDKYCKLNCDFNKDGKCDLNCDTNGDGKCDKNCDFDGDSVCDWKCDVNGDGKCDLHCGDDHDFDYDDDGDYDYNDDDEKPQIGSVLFSFNEGSNYIKMNDVLPTSDEIGMNLSGNREYFDFNVSSKIKGSNKGTLVYEISLVPIAGNTIDTKDIRVNLTENSKSVSIAKEKVSNFSDLPDSKYRKNAKVIYRKSVTRSYDANYVFRMWLSSEAEVSEISEIFACKVVVDAYYK